MFRIVLQIVFSFVYLMSSNFALASERPAGGPPPDMLATFFAESWNKAGTLGKFLQLAESHLNQEEVDGIKAEINSAKVTLDTVLPQAEAKGDTVTFSSGEKIKINADGSVVYDSHVYRKSGPADKTLKKIMSSTTEGKSAVLFSLLFPKAHGFIPLIVVGAAIVILLYAAWQVLRAGMGATGCFNTTCDDRTNPNHLVLLPQGACKGTFSKLEIGYNNIATDKDAKTSGITDDDIKGYGLSGNNEVIGALNSLMKKCLETSSHRLNSTDSSEVLGKIDNIPLQRNVRTWLKGVQSGDGTQ